MNPTPHPDPNLISAFAEQALNKDERAAVVLHLSLCAECRELLSLVSAEKVPLASPKRWPAWTAAAVGMAAICALVYLSIPLPKPATNLPVLVAKNTPAATIPAPSPSASKVLHRQPKSVQRAVPAAPAPISIETSQTGPPQQDQQILIAPSTSQFAPAGAMLQSFQARASLPLIRWRIDSAAELQRSTDAGRTWETVRVADGDRKLTDAITRIDVSATRIDLTTASGEKWTSTDGGTHWK